MYFTGDNERHIQAQMAVSEKWEIFVSTSVFGRYTKLILPTPTHHTTFKIIAVLQLKMYAHIQTNFTLSHNLTLVTAHTSVGRQSAVRGCMYVCESISFYLFWFTIFTWQT